MAIDIFTEKQRPPCPIRVSHYTGWLNVENNFELHLINHTRIDLFLDPGDRVKDFLLITDGNYSMRTASGSKIGTAFVE